MFIHRAMFSSLLLVAAVLTGQPQAAYADRCSDFVNDELKAAGLGSMDHPLLDKRSETIVNPSLTEDRARRAKDRGLAEFLWTLPDSEQPSEFAADYYTKLKAVEAKFRKTPEGKRLLEDFDRASRDLLKLPSGAFYGLMRLQQEGGSQDLEVLTFQRARTSPERLTVYLKAGKPRYIFSELGTGEAPANKALLLTGDCKISLFGIYDATLRSDNPTNHPRLFMTSSLCAKAPQIRAVASSAPAPELKQKLQALGVDVLLRDSDYLEFFKKPDSLYYRRCERYGDDFESHRPAPGSGEVREGTVGGAATPR